MCAPRSLFQLHQYATRVSSVMHHAPSRLSQCGSRRTSGSVRSGATLLTTPIRVAEASTGTFGSASCFFLFATLACTPADDGGITFCAPRLANASRARGARGRETFGGHPVQLYQVFSLITSESYQLYDFGTKSIRIRFEFTPYVYRMPHSEKWQGLKFDGNLRPFEPDDADDDVTHGVPKVSCRHEHRISQPASGLSQRSCRNVML